jgi:hypothetical protein
MGEKLGSFQVYANPAKNRIYIFFKGFMPDDMVKNAVDQIVTETRKLTLGFDVITDIATFRPATPKGAEDIKRGQEFINQYGVRRIIRVVDMKENLISKMQFDRLSEKHYDQKVQITAVGSLAEADELLDRS